MTRTGHEAGTKHLGPGTELRASPVLESLLKNQWNAILPSFFGAWSSKTSHFLRRVLVSSIKIWCETPQGEKKDKLLLLELKRNTKAPFSRVKIAINTHWMLHVKNMPLTPQTEQLLSSVFFFSSSSRSSPTAKTSRDKKECASRE